MFTGGSKRRPLPSAARIRSSLRIPGLWLCQNTRCVVWVSVVGRGKSPGRSRCPGRGATARCRVRCRHPVPPQNPVSRICGGGDGTRTEAECREGRAEVALSRGADGAGIGGQGGVASRSPTWGVSIPIPAVDLSISATMFGERAFDGSARPWVDEIFFTRRRL